MSWKDEAVPDWFQCDGCSASPDFWWGICCRYHDWWYSPWSMCDNRLEADREFARRLHLSTRAFWLALLYYLGVRIGGWRAWKRDGHGNASRVPSDWTGPDHVMHDCWR